MHRGKEQEARFPCFDSRFSSFLFRGDSLALSCTSLGPSFSFLRRDRYPRLYYKYTCNFVRRRGFLPPSPLAWRRTRYTSTVLTCARYLCRGNRARLFSARSRVLYMAGTISAFVPNVPRAFPLISFPFVLPWPLPLFEASSRMYVATARGIKYNKDIQWELIGYLRIYRSLRAALLRRGPVTARALLSFLPARSSPPLLPPLLRSLLFVFHLFAGRAAGSNGDIPRWNNIEPRF